MDQFLDYIERYKFAIVGTILFHVIFFLTTNFVTINEPYGVEEEITEIALESDEIELTEEMLEMLNRQNDLVNEEASNLVSDENDTRERSYENFSTQEIDRQVEEEARQLEQKFFDDWAKTHPDNKELPERTDNGLIDDSQSDNQSKPNPNEFNDSGDKSFAGPVMASFNLKDRDVHSLKVPGYTCNGAGVVVIDIKVDRSGDVKAVDFNPGLSSGATECMIEKSKSYAKRARFNYSGSADGLQSGTITYRFKGQ